MKLDRFSERYGPTGNLASEGARNQLGRPKLDPLAVLVREAVQNCWDAHDPADPFVRVEFGLVTLDEQQRDALASMVFADPAPHLDMHTRLADRETPMRMLVISDRNTTGLTGPTRADETPEPGEHTDFVDFLRNIGQPPDKGLGGGTFGYGKAALYRMSRLRSILVDTRCRRRGALERRFIGACLGTGYADEHGRYTGRHWWGRMSAEGDIADPLLGTAADAVANALRLPGFAADECGTTVVLPDFGTDQSRKPETLLKLLVQALLWNFWPKMIPGSDGRPPILFRLHHDGVERRIPDPRTWPPLDGFCKALEAARTSRRLGPEAVHDPLTRARRICSQRPAAELGDAAFIRMPAAKWETPPEDGVELGGIPARRSHHVAWMRDAELVVKYDAGPPPTGDVLDWAGVFVVSREADRPFAKAEPPTHDDWVAANLDEDWDRRKVRAGIREVKTAMQEFAEPGSSDRGSGSTVPLGALARSMGALLTGHVGLGGERARPEAERTAPASRLMVDEEQDAPEPETELPEAPEREGEAAKPEPGAPASYGSGEGGVPELPDGFGVAADGPVEPGAALVGSAASSPAPEPPPPPPLPPGRPMVRPQEPRLEVDGDLALCVVPFTVRHGVRSRMTRVSADLRVELDGAHAEHREDAPRGADFPEVVGWEGPDGASHPGSTTLTCELEGTWHVRVRLIDEAPVQVRLVGVAGELP